jgi:hypothetical protein
MKQRPFEVHRSGQYWAWTVGVYYSCDYYPTADAAMRAGWRALGANHACLVFT